METTPPATELEPGLSLVERQLLASLRALRRGDFSTRLPDDLGGIAGEICEAFNDIAQRAGSIECDVAQLRESVGRAGHTSRRLRRGDLPGGWGNVALSVNELLDDLTRHTDDIARVVDAVANGDFRQRIMIADEHSLRGDFLQHALTVNGMVAQLAAIGSEVTRVAQEVGVDGKLGAQANVKGVGGAWKELTDGVNLMARNLTSQVREIARVTTAVAQGDLTKTVSMEVHGEVLELKNTINTMVEQLRSFADEVTRVAREVGSEGQLGGQANVRGVSGVWRELTENVNSMANNLTLQVRNIAEVATAIAAGDLSKKITVEVKGEILELKNTINTTVDKLNHFSAEVTRVARLVGTEGTLGVQADVKDVSGIWKELTDNVNLMGRNLADQVRDIAAVTTAVANGDLSKKITVEVRGEILELKDTINAMVDSLSSFADEVTRMAREVGTEGVLGGQAVVRDVSGIWKELTDNVNSMASNLTNQVRNIAEVASAVAAGDLSRKITVDARGEVQELKTTINNMVDQLNAFGAEVTRVARDVGVEGRLGGQAEVAGVRGSWKELTDNVNLMASNLTNQVRDIAEVTTAVARGDLTRKIVVDARGEILELKNTINTMVDQLSSFADEVTRLASDVGVEGQLGGQADVRGVSGTWRDLTDAVNSMANNLTEQVRNISQVATAIAQGDLQKKIVVDARGEILELKNTINTMVDQLGSFAEQVTRVAREVGTEGKLGGQASVEGVRGIWKELTDNVNLMASNLTNQVRDIADVTTAVATGDLSRKITVEVRGEILELKNTINTMVDQLSAFAAEVTRVAREVGTDGILGGQAEVRGVSGMWRELTGNVNVMARNLTEQVRGIARVVTAVADGDLTQKLRLDAKGEIATLVDTIDNMIGTLSTFADQVTGVARDVGVEGKLGGQADVPGAAGIWRDLTNNVNELAGNLTRQVRAIGDVATAVTKGDLTQSITVEARGEVALLKDNINQMIRTLAETTRLNREQDWLKTNLTRFTRMLQGQRDLPSVAQQVLSELAPVVDAQAGAFYMTSSDGDRVVLRSYASYAYGGEAEIEHEFAFGEGLIGQAAVEKQRIVISEAPPDYVRIGSALGSAPPRNIVVVPILFEDEVKGVIELASVRELTRIQLAFLDQLLESFGIVVATIEATMRTDDLLRQSQSLAEELQNRQDELQQTNEELAEKARQLTRQKAEVERKNQEVELARQELEEKAEQLALTSRYKSQFLANMSHELRTPLNSLLILSRQLSDNPSGNLDEKQVEYARTVHQAGVDLLELINEILDLAKIESGTIAIQVEEIAFEGMREYTERSFRQIAEQKGLEFAVVLDAALPQRMATDDMRLKQVIRNLLSNAFKFTETGGVTLRIEPCAHPTIGRGVGEAGAIAFSVHDTGIGIPTDQQRIIFEAFQQADGGTSRRYGGTGLGLSISREIAKLLGGELVVESEPKHGSTFTLYLPATTRAPDARRRITPRSTPTLAVLPDTDEVASLADDRDDVHPSDIVALIIARDESSARLTLDAAHTAGFRGVVALDGRTGLELSRTLRPAAIVLDDELPDMDPWVVLDRLKHTAATRHVAVQLCGDGDFEHRALANGAIAYVRRPVDSNTLARALTELHAFAARRVERLLVVEDDPRQRKAIAEVIGNGSVHLISVDSGEAALRELETSDDIRCLVLDLRLPGMSGWELMHAMRERGELRRIPIVVYTGAELDDDERIQLAELADSVIVKDAASPEQLFAVTSLFLHRAEERLPERKREILRHVWQTDPTLQNRRVLVVDDDIRNIFAVTAVLERYGIDVSYAENGEQGLERLQHEDYDLVLMDIMMPEMDGYEATRRIRAQARWRDLPIIALTAKAMKGDRDKCLQAGASDYVTKPVDPDQLLSLLRVWLRSRPSACHAIAG